MIQHSGAGIGLSRSDVFWELTRAAKLGRIAERGCTHFIDDLPEVLSEPAFPKVERILFDPNGLHGGETEFPRVLSWTEIWDKVQSAAAPEETEQGIKEFLAERGFAATRASSLSRAGATTGFIWCPCRRRRCAQTVFPARPRHA